MQNILITGPAKTGKYEYADALSEDNSTIKLDTHHAKITNLIANLSTQIINKSDHEPLTIVVQHLDYEMGSTTHLIRIIEQIMDTIANLNANATDPVVDKIIWVGTRNNLVKLFLSDALPYRLMSNKSSLTSFTVATHEIVNDVDAGDYQIDNNEGETFKIYTIDEVNK